MPTGGSQEFLKPKSRCARPPGAAQTVNLRLSNHEPLPGLAVHVGTLIRATVELPPTWVHRDNVYVPRPAAMNTSLPCVVSSAQRSWRAATTLFLASRPGRTGISSSVANLPAGLANPGYSVRVCRAQITLYRDGLNVPGDRRPRSLTWRVVSADLLHHAA